MKKHEVKLKVISLALLLTFFGLTNSCKKTTDVPGTNEVFIQGTGFTPSSITVSAGTTITWTNKDAITHTVTSNTGLFDSGSVNSGGTYSHLFSATGTFPYHCTVHPSMTATVIVN